MSSGKNGEGSGVLERNTCSWVCGMSSSLLSTFVRQIHRGRDLLIDIQAVNKGWGRASSMPPLRMNRPSGNVPVGMVGSSEGKNKEPHSLLLVRKGFTARWHFCQACEEWGKFGRNYGETQNGRRHGMGKWGNVVPVVKGGQVTRPGRCLSGWDHWDRTELTQMKTENHGSFLCFSLSLPSFLFSISPFSLHTSTHSRATRRLALCEALRTQDTKQESPRAPHRGQIHLGSGARTGRLNCNSATAAV